MDPMHVIPNPVPTEVYQQQQSIAAAAAAMQQQQQRWQTSSVPSTVVPVDRGIVEETATQRHAAGSIQVRKIYF